MHNEELEKDRRDRTLQEGIEEIAAAANLDDEASPDDDPQPHEDVDSSICRLCQNPDSRHAIDVGNARKLLLLWTYRAHKAASSHYHQSVRLRFGSFCLTVFNAFSAVAVLYFVNANWLPGVLGGGEEGTVHLLFTGVFGAMVVGTSILQFILKMDERQAVHREAGQEFSNLQRKIERYSLHSRFTMSLVHNISRDYNHITKSYPLVGRRIWQHGSRIRLNEQITNLETDLRDTSDLHQR